jgi:hypothetical protein
VRRRIAQADKGLGGNIGGETTAGFCPRRDHGEAASEPDDPTPPARLQRVDETECLLEQARLLPSAERELQFDRPR